jgi:hypothetical protein
MSRLAFVAIFVFTIPHNISAQNPSATIPFCEMVSHPEIYDGKVVSVVAVAIPGEHSLIFSDPACKPVEERNTSTQMVLPDSVISTSLGKKLSKTLRRMQNAKVSVIGRFYGSGGPYGADNARFRFVVERVNSVARVYRPV